MAWFRKVVGGLVKSDIEQFVGEEGNIFFDVETGGFRLSDGVTPGGIPLGTGGGGGTPLFPATATRLGGVKIGENIDVAPDGTISVATPYTLPTASNSIKGGVRIGSGLQVDENGTVSVSAVPGSLTVSHIDSSNNISNVLDDITTIRFDTDSGFDVVDLGDGAVKISMNSTFKTWKVDGQSDLVATGLDTIRFVAGSGMAITTDPLAATKTITFSSTGDTGGSTDSPIKTFNILNEFSAPLLGKAVYVPVSTNVVRSVQLTNGRAVGTDLMVGLYRNNELLNFFTIPAGNYTYKYSGLNYTINTNDYLTVNVVAGSGENFSMGLFNIDT